ncbi:MAG: energy transducer TonB [Polyangiaceae bacterium]
MTTTIPERFAPPEFDEVLRAARPTRDMLGPVLEFGNHGVKVGALVGFLVAFLMHGYAVARVATALPGMGDWVLGTRAQMREFLLASYDIEEEKKKEEEKKEEEKPKEEEKVEEKQPEPQEQPQPQQQQQQQPKNFTPRTNQPQTDTNTTKPTSDDPYNDAAPSNAGLLPQDFTGNGTDGWQAGNGGGGFSGPGDCKKGLNCKPGKAPPPQPTQEPVAAAPTVDKSRAAEVTGSKSWSCPFPAEADGAGKDSATVVLVVTVRADGSPEKVDVVQDPGTGFGREARKCALQKRYKAGLDRDGNSVRKATLPITVRFTR